MLLKDKYCPLFLKDSLINQKYYKKFGSIFNENNMLNTIVHGPKSCGKFSIIKCLINSLYNENIKCTNKTFKISVNNTEKEIVVNSSEYHFEIYLDKYLFNNKLYLFGLIDNITDSKEINGITKKKIVIIRNINHAPNEFLNYIKSKMEKISASCVFFLTTNNISKIHKSMLGHFMCFRLPYPEKKELKSLITTIISNENMAKKSPTFINSLIEQNNFNISTILLNLELNINNTNYRHDDLYNKNKIIEKLKEPNPENIIFFRNELYNISSKNICVRTIINDLVFHFIKNEKLSNTKKIEIIQIYSKLERNLSKSYKDIVIYETILVNLFKIIHI